MFVLHGLLPVAVAIGQVLTYLAANTDSFDLADATRALALATALALAGWGILLRPLGDPRKAAILASVAALLFWSSSSLLTALGEVWVPYLGPAVLAFAWGVGLPLIGLALARTPRNVSPLYFITTVAALGGVVVPFGSIAFASPEARMLSVPPLLADQPAIPSRRPDIYLIVLDAYGRDDDLRRHFGIEQGLGAQLEALGFYVARHASTNYSTTVHSIPSLLNSDFIHNLLPEPSVAQLIELTHRNRFIPFLERLGYKTIVYQSGYALTEIRNAGHFIEAPPPRRFLGVTARLRAFERGLLAWTPFDAWIRGQAPLSPYTQHRERILHGLWDISRHAEDPDPTFAFLHVLSPHEPFVFDADGGDVSPRDLPYRLDRIFDDSEQPAAPGQVGPEYARRYRAQAGYIAERVAAAAKDILRRSPDPPVVVILGDHGPYGFGPNIRHTRPGILHAFFLPDGRGNLLYPTISPVNSLRVLMNEYFGADLSLLPDRGFRTTYERPAEYVEVE